jgi:succinate-semialdehyde dehydrogenase/glutarate-semialdehyde dehydrogenase
MSNLCYCSSSSSTSSSYYREHQSPNFQILITQSPRYALCTQVGPCFAAGCSAVVKPAEATPLSALALAELGCRAGVPAGLLSILPAPRSSSAALGEQLCKHPVVRKVSFTGSTQVGVTLARW